MRLTAMLVMLIVYRTMFDLIAISLIGGFTFQSTPNEGCLILKGTEKITKGTFSFEF